MTHCTKHQGDGTSWEGNGECEKCRQERMDDYNIVREACIRANPEIVKPALRAGVLCLMSREGERDIGSYDVAINANYEVLEVIGRSIRLADLLLAYEEKGGDVMLVINRGGEFGTWHLLKNLPSWQHIFWNLRTDSLSQQSPQTLKFLAKLLRSQV